METFGEPVSVLQPFPASSQPGAHFHHHHPVSGGGAHEHAFAVPDVPRRSRLPSSASSSASSSHSHSSSYDPRSAYGDSAGFLATAASAPGVTGIFAAHSSAASEHYPAFVSSSFAASHSHSRTNSAASSSPYTDLTSMSEGDGGSPGGRKASVAALGMKRARTNVGPYQLRQAASSASDISNGSPGSRRSSISSHVSDAADDELADFLRRGSVGPAPLSREGSIHSQWGDNGQFPTSGAGQTNATSAMHVDPVTGMLIPSGAAAAAGGGSGFGMDPYGGMHAAHQQHGMQPQPFSLAAPPPGFGHAAGMMPDGGMAMSQMQVAGMQPYGAGPGGMMMGGPLHAGLMHAPPRMAALAPAATMGGAAAQMGRMSLDSSETYEALAHHIRSANTTSAADRARQAFVQAWLNSSYMAYTDGNVSRQGLYGSYLKICNQYDIKPINAASFGKAVRQCFPNIKTRRLGVRGNSKYHYCGIRPSTQREAEILVALSRSEKPEGSGNGGRTSSAETEEEGDSDSGEQSLSLPSTSHLDLRAPVNGRIPDGSEPMPPTPRTARPNMAGGMGQSQQAGAFEDRGLKAMALPSLDEALQAAGPAAGDLDVTAAETFWEAFTEHSKSLLDVVRHLRFDQFELNLRTFWTGLDDSARGAAQHPVVTSLIYRTDAIVYDEILDYLHAQTLNPMPPAAFTALRQLAQSMEQVIIVALEAFPSTFVGPKIELAARFGHLIIRHLGICQLSQALAGVFATPTALREMVEAWDGIDFEAVRNQAALVTSCQHDVLGGCFEEFRRVLADPHANIESFISFVESTYERCLLPAPDGERPPSPRSLLVRWSYVSSQLLRDLTLRSATTFGSFQIVNLFFDEWLGFKVLRKVALHVAAVPTVGDPGMAGPGAGSNFAPGNAGLLSVDVYGANSGGDSTMPFIFTPSTTAAFAAAQEAQSAAQSSAGRPGGDGDHHSQRSASGADADGDAEISDDPAGPGAGAVKGSPGNDFSDLMDVSAFGAAMNEQGEQQSPAHSTDG